MRLRLSFAALILVGAACRDSITDPYRTTTDPLPSGLPVAFRTPRSAADSLTGDRPSITAAGDSVLVAVKAITNGCSIQTLHAGFAGGVLVVTRLDSFLPEGVYCALVAYGPSTFRAVVRSVPSGRYAVAVRDRYQISAAGSEFKESELARGAVTLP